MVGATGENSGSHGVCMLNTDPAARSGSRASNPLPALTIRGASFALPSS